MVPELRHRMILVVAFLVLVVGGDRLMSLGIDHVVLQSGVRYSQLYRGGLAKEIVILGDSRSVHSFHSPEIEKRLGIGCINLSHNAMSTEIMEALLRDYVEANNKPSLIVLGLTSLGSSTHWPIRELRMYTRYSMRLARLAREYDERNYYASQVASLYAYNSDMFLRSLYYLNETDQGWANRRRILPTLTASVESSPPMAKSWLRTPRNEQLAALKRILAYAAERNIKVALVMTPFLPQYRDKMQDFSSWMDILTEAIGNDVRIYDYSRVVADERHFQDRIHVNLDGANVLLDSMIEDGLFPVP